MMPSLKRGATFSVNSARARVDFTKPSPHSRAASCAQEFERGEAAVAAGRIIAGWHLINVVISRGRRRRRRRRLRRDASGHERERMLRGAKAHRKHENERSERLLDLSATIFENCEWNPLFLLH